MSEYLSDHVRLGDDRASVIILDQTLLPNRVEYLTLREPEEIRSQFYSQPMAPAGVKCYNPAFDVTSHALIAGIVTEEGICRPPYTQSLAAQFR